jgi:hypothetical protein
MQEDDPYCALQLRMLMAISIDVTEPTPCQSCFPFARGYVLTSFTQFRSLSPCSCVVTLDFVHTLIIFMSDLKYVKPVDHTLLSAMHW